MKNPIVFISYSSVDRLDALTVRDILRQSGCTVWLDVFDIRVAADLKRELGDGIGGADVMCLLLSPSSVLSPWVAEEIARGEQEAIRRGLRVIPVLLRPCRPPDALLGKVMLDATEGLVFPDVRARLTRAVVGKEAVDDATLDLALQEALALRHRELDAARMLPELAKTLAEVRDEPIRELRISIDHEALPADRVVAVGLEFDRLFSQPMWFLFARYREGRTWPAWMEIEELDHSRIRLDGKRVDGRLQWFNRVLELSEELDGTDLRDLPAAFNLTMSGDVWQPRASIATYEGGPTVPHLAQKFELPPLSKLIEKGATFGVSLVGEMQDSAQPVAPDQNDFDVRVVASYPSGRLVTLFRSTHTPLERAILKGSYLADRPNAIEREAILGLFPRETSLAAEQRAERRQRVLALAEKPEAELSPEERRPVAVLHHGRAVLEMSRVFGNAPPPGPARQQLHERALSECSLVFRLLQPLVAVEPRLDDVGMAYWSASNIAHFYRVTGDVAHARAHAEAALTLARGAVAHDPHEPAYRRFEATALARLSADQAASGDRTNAGAGLRESVGLIRSLYEAWPNTARGADLEAALGGALEHAADWHLEKVVPAAEWRTELVRLRELREEMEETAGALGIPADELYPLAGPARSLRITRGSGERNGTASDYVHLEPPPDLDKETRSKLDRVLARHGYEWMRELVPGGRLLAAQWKGFWERWRPLE